MTPDLARELRELAASSFDYRDAADALLTRAADAIEEMADPDGSFQEEIRAQAIYDAGEGIRSEVELRESQVDALEALNAAIRAENAKLREECDTKTGALARARTAILETHDANNYMRRAIEIINAALT